jgi:transcriptional antiterminator RfaH
MLAAVKTGLTADDQRLMGWYAIHTKPRQEQRALVNLEQQGYQCYLPVFLAEKLSRGRLSVVEEPLFSRYLFICLDTSRSGKGWATIRSTRGVSSLVTIGTEPAKVDMQLIDSLRHQQNLLRNQPQRLFTSGERLLVNDGPFTGIEAIYQMTSGENRAMVLIELMGKLAQMKLQPSSLRKIV